MPSPPPPALMFTVAALLAACIDDDARLRDDAGPPDTTATTAVSETSEEPDVVTSEDSGDVSQCVGCSIEAACIPFQTINPDNPCLECHPSAPSEWTFVSNETPCDDGDPCHALGACFDGECAAPLTPQCRPECVTSSLCIGESCDYQLAPETCLIEGTCHAENDVEDEGCLLCSPSQDPFGWTAKACGDDIECTLDLCDGGQCRHDVTSGMCLVEGKCRDEGERAPDETCLMCDPDLSQQGWSARAGASCSDGDACTTADTCSDEAECAGQPLVVDIGDNDTLAKARALGSQGVTEFPVGGGEPGNINPKTDVDWYSWRMPLEAIGVTYRPHAALETNHSRAVRLCVLATCGQAVEDVVSPTVSCPDTATSITEGSAVGCCVLGVQQDELDLELDATCPLVGAIQHGQAFARVSFPDNASIPEPACMNYKLQWGASPEQ